MSSLSSNEVNDAILNAIRVAVWSGFYAPEDVQDMVGDLLEDGANEEMLRAAVEPEFERKARDETAWPAVTDCDRLTAVFACLETRKILCLPNAGYTMSDGHEDAHEALSNRPGNAFFGYCFYHGQDLERAVNGEGLMLAYDHVKGDVPDKELVARTIKEELEREGFFVAWDGRPNSRIHLPQIDWKQRYRRGAPGTRPVAAPVAPASKVPSFWQRLLKLVGGN